MKILDKTPQRTTRIDFQVRGMDIKNESISLKETSPKEVMELFGKIRAIDFSDKDGVKVRVQCYDIIAQKRKNYITKTIYGHSPSELKRALVEMIEQNAPIEQ